MLRRPLEPKQYVAIRYTERLLEAGIEPAVGSVGDSYDPALFTKAGENWRQFPDFPLLATEELNHLPRHMRHPLGETPSTQPIGWLF